MFDVTEKARIETAVRRWVSEFVVALNLCPFANKELLKGSVRFSVLEQTDNKAVLEVLIAEFKCLNEQADIETSLLILPNGFADFGHFLALLDDANACIEQMDLLGVYQLASFHPQYQFADTHVDDVENYSNRSPYPVLHILREDSVETAIALSADIASIPLRNIALLKRMGRGQVIDMLKIISGDAEG